jgi:hypothetical protein
VKQQLENTLKWLDRQAKNSLGNLTPLADLRLKCCIEGKKFKNKITGSNSWSGIWSGLNPFKWGETGLNRVKIGAIRHTCRAVFHAGNIVLSVVEGNPHGDRKAFQWVRQFA